jgi:hypothetical protein
LGRRSTAPLILNLDTVWRKIVSLLDSFIQKENLKLRINRRREAQKRSGGGFGEA